MTSRSLAPVLAAAIILSVACGARSGATPPPETGSVRAFGSPTQGGTYDMTVQVTRSDRVYSDTVPVDATAAWGALPAIYRVLELPVSARDAGRRAIAVSGAKVRRVEGQAMSRYVDCGRGFTAGAIADSYDVYVWVETRLVPRDGDPTRANVETAVTANASPASSSGNEVACQSTGRLERRISELLHNPAAVTTPAR